MAGSRPKHYRQNEIGCRCGNQQHFHIHICIKNTVIDRHPAARQQPQRQHAARHSTGYGKQQQDQPQQILLPAKSHQSQQYAYRYFSGKSPQELKSRQKGRHRVDSAQECGEQVPPPSQRDTCQPGGHKKEHVVHSPVQHKHAVRVHHRHPVSSFRFTGSIIGQAACKYRRKKEMDGRSRPFVFLYSLIRKARSWMPPEPKS